MLATMVVVPLWRSRRDDHWTFGYEQLRLVGSPAAATIWVVMVIAAQQGDVAATLRQWGAAALAVAVWTVVAGLASAVLYLIANRHGLGELAKVVLRPVAILVYRVSFGVCAALVAVAVAAVSLPLSIIGWMSALESEHSRRRRLEVEMERSDHGSRPTGASVVPIRAA